jgi:hypothetical protein
MFHMQKKCGDESFPFFCMWFWDKNPLCHET